ncbi:MAG: electron transport complex subunit RsxG [Chromatiaceae bacterium]|jgi:electron transport complex protein RnfG|nr:electron transport complex subunit RsxG [Chromatiaceae bacterium]
MSKAPVLLAGFILGAFAVGGVSLVAMTQALTSERIAANERAATLRNVAAIIPTERMDNDPLQDMIRVSDPDLLGSESTRVFRIRSGGEPLALVLDPVVPDGYAGPIKLLVSVLVDGSLGGVRVIAHRETPGLGDKIETAKSDWVLGFAGKSLGNPPPEQWSVKRDGGAFDQFAGATITPRAVVRAVKNTLRFVERNSETLYGKPATPVKPPDQGDS